MGFDDLLYGVIMKIGALASHLNLPDQAVQEAGASLGISSEQISSRSTNLLKIQIWVQFSAQETRATLAAIRAPRRATAAWKKLRSGKWAHLFFSPKIQRNSINPHSFPWMKSLLQFALSGTKVSKWTFLEVCSKLVGYFQKKSSNSNKFQFAEY